MALAPFADFGMNMALLPSQLKISANSLNLLNTTQFGCPEIVDFQCAGGTFKTFNGDLKTIAGTNYVPRMSTGLELQVLLPIIQAPFRIYYAYNPLILNTSALSPNPITRAMFPPGGAGDSGDQQVG